MQRLPYALSLCNLRYYQNQKEKMMGYMTDGLTFNTLRQANLKRMPQFKNKLGEPAHSEADGSDWTPADWCVAVMGELGELANLLKKVKRNDFPLEELPKINQQISWELADVQTYLDILAFRLGVDLGQATIEKFNVVSDRVGSSVFIRDDGSDYKIVQEE